MFPPPPCSPPPAAFAAPGPFAPGRFVLPHNVLSELAKWQQLPGELFWDDTSAAVRFGDGKAFGGRALTSEALSGAYMPEDFGAAGDGVTDDAPAMLAMLNGTPDGSVYRLTGQYGLGSTMLHTANNRTWLGQNGARVLRLGSNTGDLIGLQGSYNKFANLELDGRRTAAGFSGNTNLFCSGSHNTLYNLDSHDAFDHAFAIDGVLGAALGDHNKIVFCKARDSNKIGISQYKAKASLIIMPEVSGTGAEGVTFDFQTVQSVLLFGSIDLAGSIGAVGGIGMDASADNFIFYPTITRTQNGLPAVCLQCETGDTSYNLVLVNAFDGTGRGIWLRRNTQSYPTVNNNVYYQSNYNRVGGSFRNNALAPIRVDTGCDSNIILDSNYSGGLLPDIDPGAVNTRMEGGAGLASFQAAGDGVNSQVNVTGDNTYGQLIIPFEEGSEPTPPDGVSPYNPATGVFTAPVSGLYQVECNVELTSTSTITTATLEVRQAGSGAKIGHNDTYATAASFLTVGVNRIFRLAAGDTLTPFVLAKTAANTKNTSVTPNGATNRFQAWLIG